MRRFLFFSMRTAVLAAVLLPAGYLSRPAHGQGVGAAQDRAQLMRTPVGLRDDSGDGADGTGESAVIASPNDPDLGEQAILKKTERYQPWGFFATSSFTYTSNVALVRTGEESDFIFTPAVGASFTPRITNDLYANLSVAQQWFVYNEFSALDFASFDAQAGLIYRVPRTRNLILRTHYDFSRLTMSDLSGEFFSDHSIVFGGEVPVRVGRAQQITGGVDFSLSFAARPDAPARHEYSTFIGYSVAFSRNLTVNAMGRMAVRDYTEGDRVDLSAILSLGAVYRFTPWLSASALTTFASNHSNQNVFDYDVFNLGGALSLNLRY